MKIERFLKSISSVVLNAKLDATELDAVSLILQLFVTNLSKSEKNIHQTFIRGVLNQILDKIKACPPN